MTKMTYHAQVERQERIDYILDHIGIGETVCEYYQEEKGTIARLTTTGVIVVLTPNYKSLVTMYVAGLPEASHYYKSVYKVSRMPNNLASRIARNKELMDRIGL